MTIEVPTPALMVVIAGALIALTGWLGRVLVLDKLTAIEKSNKDQGKRIGATEAWQEAHDKVEDYAHRRRLTAGQGNPSSDDPT